MSLPLLQYQSLQAVLMHMDANTRFRISVHMPSVRRVEKMLPLKIEKLHIFDTAMDVNNTRYNLGVIRHYPDGNAPPPIDEELERGGSDYDFDEFGFPVTSGSKVLLPGDVSMDDREIVDEFDTEHTERMEREALRVLEKALVRRTDLKSKGITVEDHLASLEPVNFGEEYSIRLTLKYDAERLLFEQKLGLLLFDGLIFKIHEARLKLLPFEYRRNNTKPPFKCYIQLTITKGESKRIQRFEYTKKLYEAAKNFNQVFFGSRKIPIRVGSFDFGYPEGTLRLPVGFRLQANEVHVTGHSLDHKKLPVLVENSTSLNSLHLRSWSTPWLTPNDFQNQIVRNAKRLSILDVKKNNFQELLPTIRDLPQLKMTISTTDSNFLPEDYIQIIEAWLSGNRLIGAYCLIEIRNEEIAKEVFELVCTRNEMTKRAESCGTTRKGTKVKIFNALFKGPKKYSFTHFFSPNVSVMKIEVV